MKLSSRKVDRESRLTLSMTSMIDVVFLLLIFFMTTAAFVTTERELESNLKIDSKARQSNVDLEPAVVECVLGTGGAVYRLGGREFQSADQLAEVLRQFPNKTDGAFVKVSDDVPYGMAATAVQVCKDAKFVSVSYIPLPPSEGS